MMCKKVMIAALFWAAIIFVSHAQSLDAVHPILLKGNKIAYEGRVIGLDSRHLYVDGTLSDAQIASSRYAFRDFREAVKHLIDGTTLYLAPYVYWVDDPKVPEVVEGKDGREPFGMVIRCNGLRIIGLNPDARNVVLASQRGQTQGAIGNFTMFDLWGDDMVFENLTLGNFCNVDLDFPLLPALSRPKRNAAITQAHVGYVHGDRISCRNVRFISRLNMNPLNGARRIFYDNCHMECTDDALVGNGVYYRCTLDFYGQKPFWGTHQCGAVFIDCDFTMKSRNREMYFTKGVGQLSLIDCRYHAADTTYIGWASYPTGWLRCYQSGVTLNGKPYQVGSHRPENTVDITAKPLIRAYRNIENGDTTYNIYNLVCGDDDWRPFDIAPQKASHMPTALLLNHREATLMTGKDTLLLRAKALCHAGFPATSAKVKWHISPKYARFVSLSATEGDSILLIPRNNTDEMGDFCVCAETEDGLQAACELHVLPSSLPAPAFTKQPEIVIGKDNIARVDYAFPTQGRRDQSDITWYRCLTDDASELIPIAVSRGDQPLKEYKLTPFDDGHRIMARVVPRHLRSLSGEPANAISRKPIYIINKVKGKNAKNQTSNLKLQIADFKNFPTQNQPKIIAGAWTIDGYKPQDTSEFPWTFTLEKPMWSYEKGFNGAEGYGLVQSQRGARLMFTPLQRDYSAMSLSLLVDPTKSAGQGFGSATGQYLDVCIKFDTQSLTGYGLRIIRTTKYSNAVDFYLVRYDNGKTVALTAPVSAICYRTGCLISVSYAEGKLKAEVSTSAVMPTDSPLARNVSLEAAVSPNSFGGIAIQHTGTCGESTTMLHQLSAEWR